MSKSLQLKGSKLKFTLICPAIPIFLLKIKQIITFLENLKCLLFLYEDVLSNCKGCLPSNDGGKGDGCLKVWPSVSAPLAGWFQMVLSTVSEDRVTYCRNHRGVGGLCCRMGLVHSFDLRLTLVGILEENRS